MPTRLVSDERSFRAEDNNSKVWIGKKLFQVVPLGIAEQVFVGKLRR